MVDIKTHFSNELFNKDSKAVQLQRCINDVVEFNSLAGNVYYDTATKVSLVSTYIGLLQSEFKEMISAKTPAKWLDGVLDQFVVGSFLTSVVEGVVYTNKLHEARYYDSYEAAAEELADSIDTIASGNTKQGCTDMMAILEDILYSIEGSVDYIKAFKKVNESNFSKIPLLEDFLFTMIGLEEPSTKSYEQRDLIEKQIELILKDGKYSDISHKIIQDSKGKDRIVFYAGWSEEDERAYNPPKIIKPVTFNEPSLEDCLL